MHDSCFRKEAVQNQGSPSSRQELQLPQSRLKPLGLLEALMQILQWAVGGREGVSD
jgi:hypothetical protein